MFIIVDLGLIGIIIFFVGSLALTGSASFAKMLLSHWPIIFAVVLILTIAIPVLLTLDETHRKKRIVALIIGDVLTNLSSLIFIFSDFQIVAQSIRGELLELLWDSSDMILIILITFVVLGISCYITEALINANDKELNGAVFIKIWFGILVFVLTMSTLKTQAYYFSGYLSLFSGTIFGFLA